MMWLRKTIIKENQNVGNVDTLESTFRKNFDKKYVNLVKKELDHRNILISILMMEIDSTQWQLLPYQFFLYFNA